MSQKDIFIQQIVKKDFRQEDWSFWEEMFRLSMDPEKARRYRAEAKPEKEDTCSMCGNFCAVKNTNRILDGEIVTIFDE